MPLLRDLRAFLGTVFRGWVAYTTGGAVVGIVGTYAAVTGPPALTARRLAWLVFVFAVVAGVFEAWRDEYRRRLQLEAVPKLRIRFVGGEAPYEQDHRAPKSEGVLNHYFRVGVTHDGQQQVEDVSVLLASLDPMPPGFPLFHALTPMGERTKGTKSITIAAGTEATRFFDVIVQVRQEFIITDEGHPKPTPLLFGMGMPVVCFATGETPGVPLSTDGMRLVAEGRNATSAELRLEMTYEQPGLLLKLRHQG